MDSGILGPIIAGGFTLAAAIFTAIDIRVRQATTGAEKRRIILNSVSFGATVVMAIGFVLLFWGDFPEAGLWILVCAALLDSFVFLATEGPATRMQIIQMIFLWGMVAFFANFYWLGRILDTQEKMLHMLKP